jgi:D-alanyl-D-alanine carboxypeptidase/D-alanyl-D-alanine-endopeptidase (penicillin-binding protein 4)
MWDDVAYDYSAQISAVTLNRNCVTVLVAPGDTVGSPVRVQLDPPTDYMRVLVEARTGPASASDSADAEPLRVERRWQERQNVLEVTGVLPLGAEERRVIRTVEDPGRYAATVFRERLAGHGISVTGETRAGRTPLRARVLASHRSEPLTAAVSFMLKESDNLAAELLVKAMGAYRSGRPGATPDGLRAVQGVLTEIAGLDTLQYRFADGSGLSWYNLVAPDQTMRLLMSAYRDSTLREPLLAALPVAGVDGTLKNRMRSSPAEGTLRAKTGTLSGASCLSGFVRTRDGETVAFSIMMNHFVGSSATARRTQDAIGALLAGFSRSRGAEEKGSKGAGMSNER